MPTSSSALEKRQSAAPVANARAQTTGSGGQLAVILALLALYLIWGSTYLAIRVAVETIPPFLMAGVRFIVAGGLMFLFLRWRGQPLPTRRQWGSAFIVGALLLIGGNGLVSVAEQWVASSLAALMLATTPIWAALFAGIWGKWPVRVEWVGLALGFLGVGLLSLEGDMRANPLGALLLLLAAGSWGLGSVVSARLTLPQGFMASAAQMLTAGAALLVAGLIGGERFDRPPSTDSLIALTYLIFVGAIVAYSAFGYLLRTVRPALATSYAYVNPAVAVILGSILLSERVTWFGVAAMIVILAGVAILAFVRTNKGAGTSPPTRDSEIAEAA